MPVDLTPPQWLKEKFVDWTSRLHMAEWEIVLRLELVPDDQIYAQAVASQSPWLNRGTITLRADVEDTEEWEVVLVHELLHIEHSRIDMFLTNVIFPESSLSEPLVKNAYGEVMEPFIHGLAVALVEMYRCHMPIPEATTEITVPAQP